MSLELRKICRSMPNISESADNNKESMVKTVSSDDTSDESADNNKVKTVSSDDTSDESADNNKVTVRNPVLAYVVFAIQNSTRENVRRVTLAHVTPESIHEAMNILWVNYEADIIGSCRSRKCDFEMDDILDAFVALDHRMIVPAISISTYALYVIPRLYPEEIASISVVERLNNMEERLNSMQKSVDFTVAKNIEHDDRLNELVRPTYAKVVTTSADIHHEQQPCTTLQSQDNRLFTGGQSQSSGGQARPLGNHQARDSTWDNQSLTRGDHLRVPQCQSRAPEGHGGISRASGSMSCVLSNQPRGVPTHPDISRLQPADSVLSLDGSTVSSRGFDLQPHQRRRIRRQTKIISGKRTNQTAQTTARVIYDNFLVHCGLPAH